MNTRLLSRFLAPLVAAAALAAPSTQAQVLLEENFTFTGQLTSNGWTAFSGAGTSVINANAPGLTYPNLPSSGVGNAADITASGEDIRNPLSEASTSGDLYTSFLVNASSATATGDYFYSFYATSGGYFGRIFARSSGAGFQIGISKNTTTVAYDTTELAFGTTYLVVAKITRNAGTNDDVASLWINPVLGGPETAALVSSTSGGDPVTIDNISLRQGTNTPVLRVGSILVGTTWASVTPTSSVSAPTITSFSPAGGPAGTPVTISGTNFIGATEVAFNGVPAIFSVDSSIQITATVPPGATAGLIQVTTPEGIAVSQDIFLLPTASVTMPTEINEGATAIGTVTLTEAPGTDVIVSLTSSSPSDLVVPVSVTVAAGFASVDFDIEAPLDGAIDTDVEVTVTPAATGYAAAPATITVRNIDAPTASLTAGGYTQDFATFVDATTLPLGWSITADGSGTTKLDYSSWDVVATGVKFSSATANVFGYQHTSSTGVARQTLTIRNETGDTITDLTIAYTGLAARLDQTRIPSYTVTVDGVEVASLAYSTNDGASVPLLASLSGLSIAPDQVFEIVWTSDRGLTTSGTSRQIGISNFSITLGAAALPPSVASLSIPLGTVSADSADVSANVTGDGGSAITARGFVYAATSANPDPVIGGAGVTDVVDPLTELGAMSATLSGLVSGTEYSIKAYATNAQGTTYTSVQTFTTLAPPASFTGNYFNAFNNFTGAGTLPGEWSAVSSTGLQTYIGDWTSASFSGGFYGGVSTPGVLGYTHTSGSGTLTVTLRLVNDTGAPITDLNVRYLGRVEAVTNTRFPTWTVTVAGTESAELFYTTEVGVDETKTASITGLSIAEGETFTITWVSDRGLPTGSSRRIGLADVVVSTSEIVDPVIDVVGSLTSFSATEGSPSSSQSFTAGGSALNGDIVVTAPADYEVSTDDVSYGSSVTLPASAGIVPATTVYVRIAATAPLGNPSGLVTIASDGATAQNIAVTGTVSAAGGYDAWASGFGLDPTVTTGPTAGAPTADPDGDSFTNEQEYAFGTNPTEGTPSLLSTESAGGNLTVQWLQRGDVTYTPQSTANLATTPFADDFSVTVVDGPVEPAPPAGYIRRQFTVPASGQNFYRVSATVPAP